MKRISTSPYPWIFPLATGLLFGAVLLRALFLYGQSPLLGQVLGQLLAWLLLLASEPTLSRRWPKYFPVYLALQTLQASLLMFAPGYTDYDFFAILFSILSMQAMQRLEFRPAALWLCLFALLTLLPLLLFSRLLDGLALGLLYISVDIFLATYARATRRAQAARARNQALAGELLASNRQLEAHAAQLEQLATARERHHLARELHDSVTQTIFSMTLTTQSALLLLDRDPARVPTQLDRLDELAQSALSEMRLLISELRPAQGLAGGLAAALRRHLAERHLPETLEVKLEVEGTEPLSSVEEQSLFRIAQEALNNIVKHAQAPRARLRLHLAEPFWMEIEDQGRGFDLPAAQASGRVGLASMRERAAEIGWQLRLTTCPGAGTCLHVEKPAEERLTP
jgi:signal transduction histidine kinase